MGFIKGIFSIKERYILVWNNDMDYYICWNWSNNVSNFVMVSGNRLKYMHQTIVNKYNGELNSI